MSVPTFDIFSGAPDRDARWIEAVSGLGEAKQRTDGLAAKEPGKYFVFDCHQHLILYSVDNRSQSTKTNDAKTARAARAAGVA